MVTLVWAACFLDAFLAHEYDALIYVSPPMGLVVGYITGVKILRKINGTG